jgi:uncharacterized repeat protein (TIGR03803 family)
VFRLAPDGTETVLHSFAGKGGDGANPEAVLLLDQLGNLYGTTAAGGNIKCGGGGCGTVFKLAPDGTEAVLHVFRGGHDGVLPILGSLIADQAGNLYGVTAQGGGNGCNTAGCGIVFKLAPDGTESILHAFVGGRHDGPAPQSNLIMDNSGNLYGTTLEGGGAGQRLCDGNGCGTVFRLATDGTETILYAFDGRDGAFPTGNIVSDQAGNFYGATSGGGHGYSAIGADKACYPYWGCGTVFELATDGTGTDLYEMYPKNGGRSPFGGLAIDQSGNLYGTNNMGGSKKCFDGCGTVFKIIP